MAIWGTENGFRGAMLRKPIRVRFGQPYNPAALANGERDQWDHLTEDLMLRIAALLPEEYRGIYRGTRRTENLAQPPTVSAIS